jgi:hypothetical protein
VGFLDRFRKQPDDPVTTFARMDHRRLREFQARLQVETSETLASIKRNKEEYARLVQRAAALSDQHEHLMVEGQSRQVLQRIQILDRNFQSQVRSAAVVGFLGGMAQEGLGAKSMRYEAELKAILRMESPRELGRALAQLSRQAGMSSAYVDDVQGLIDSYLEAPGTNPAVVGSAPQVGTLDLPEPAERPAAKRKDVVFEGR